MNVLIRHRKYNPPSPQYDIGIFILATPVENFGDNQIPILNTDPVLNLFKNNTIKLYGYGYNEYNRGINHMREMELEHYTGRDTFCLPTKLIFCFFGRRISSSSNRSASGYGDSGGPIVLHDKSGKTHLVGIHNAYFLKSTKVVRYQAISIAANVKNFVHWITHVLQKWEPPKDPYHRNDQALYKCCDSIND